MAKRQFNADTNKWEEKAPKTKPTPASNTRKKMKKAAEAEKKKPAAKAPAPAKKAAPVPKPRGSRPKGESGNPANQPSKKEPPKNLRLPKKPGAKSPVGKMPTPAELKKMESGVGKFPSKSEMEKGTGVKLKDRRFLRGTFMTGKDRK